jgi:tetratricopeptide (TPR) repeat protein
MGGRLGEALEGFGRVLSHDAECVEAIEGVRRIAQTAGDALGQARALARLATLAKGPRSVGLFAESARQFEQAGQPAQAITLCWRVLEERPDDQEATTRLTALLTAKLDAPERAADYERLLAHRLSLLPAEHADRVPLLLDRAGHRLHRREDRSGAIADFKRILKIVPYHEEALAELSALAVAEPSPRDAARLLERYVAVARDAELAAQARLELAASYETLQDAGRAVEILEHAAALTPADPRPRERLVDLLLRVSDWRGALGALRAWDQATTDPQAKAQLYLRIGALLRDQALDQSGAAQSFRLAADLDPLGDGARALVALYESLGDAPGRARAIAREIAELRQALAADPLDVARLHRLKEFLVREAVASAPAFSPGSPSMPATSSSTSAGPPSTSEAVAPVAQVLALLGEGAEPADAPQARRRLGAGLSATAFWDRLALPQTSGFLSEIWALIAAAVAELHHLDTPAISLLGLSRQNRVAPGSEPRLGWVEAAAVALGVEGLTCYASPQPLGEQGDAGVVALELPDPVLVFDRAALAGGAGARFRFGRALGLLRQRATVLDRLGGGGETDDLRHLFLAAGAIAGGSRSDDPGAAAPAAIVKALGKVLSRKDRKMLTLQASRFAFEASDVEAWRRGMLGTADRLGLVISGDVAAAARVAANAHGVLVGANELRASPSAMELLRFALDVAYLELRVEAGGVAG